MKRILAILTILFLSYLGRGEVYAQPGKATYLVKGKVIESGSKNNLQYVNVAIFSIKDSTLVTGSITDENGEFEIVLKRPGKFYLTVDFVGYEKIMNSEIVLSPDNEEYDAGIIVLKQSSIGINEVEVVAEKPFLSYKIDRKVVDVSKNPMAQGGTAVEALDNVPSIDVDIEGNVSLRGSTSFTVLIDGRQSPLSGSDALSQIPASAISQIEIITNPSAKYDPDGTAGIINIITKKGKLKGHSLVINAGVGTPKTVSTDFTYAYRSKKYTMTIGAGFRNDQMNFNHYTERETQKYDSLNNFIGNYYMYNNRDGIMKHNSSHINLGLDYYISQSNTLSIGGNYHDFLFSRSFNSEIHTVTIDNISSYELSSTGARVNPKSYQINIGDRQEFNDDKDHYFQFDLLYQKKKSPENEYLNRYYSDSLWRQLEPVESEQKAETYEDAKRIRLEANYSNPIGENHIFEAGYTYRNDSYTQDYDRYYRNDTITEWLLNPDYSDVAKFNRDIHAGWALIRGTQFGLQYSAGLRFEYTNRLLEIQNEGKEYRYEYLGWYPTLSLAKEWGSGNILQASYSKRISRPRDFELNPFPSLSDGYVIYLSNPNLEPEHASALELNYQKTWGSSFLSIESFYRDSYNEMQRVTETRGDTVVYRRINIGSEKDMGVEITANVKLFKWWTINPSLNYKYEIMEGTAYDDYDRVTSTNFRGSFTNNFAITSKTRLQIMSRYRGPSAEINGDREASYWTSGALRQDFLDRKLTATLRVEDIFNSRSREDYTYSDNITIYTKRHRQSPMFFLSLSYRFNQDNDKRGKRNENGGDTDSSMDEDF